MRRFRPAQLLAPCQGKWLHEREQRDFEMRAAGEDLLHNRRRQQRQAQDAADVGRIDLLRCGQLFDGPVGAGLQQLAPPKGRARGPSPWRCRHAVGPVRPQPPPAPQPTSARRAYGWRTALGLLRPLRADGAGLQRAGIDRRRARVGALPGQGQRASPILLRPPGPLMAPESVALLPLVSTMPPWPATRSVDCLRHWRRQSAKCRR